MCFHIFLNMFGLLFNIFHPSSQALGRARGPGPGQGPGPAEKNEKMLFLKQAFKPLTRSKRCQTRISLGCTYVFVTSQCLLHNFLSIWSKFDVAMIKSAVSEASPDGFPSRHRIGVYILSMQEDSRAKAAAGWQTGCRMAARLHELAACQYAAL